MQHVAVIPWHYRFACPACHIHMHSKSLSIQQIKTYVRLLVSHYTFVHLSNNESLGASLLLFGSIFYMQADRSIYIHRPLFGQIHRNTFCQQRQNLINCKSFYIDCQCEANHSFAIVQDLLWCIIKFYHITKDSFVVASISRRLHANDKTIIHSICTSSPP